MLSQQVLLREFRFNVGVLRFVVRCAVTLHSLSLSLSVSLSVSLLSLSLLLSH
jgi:hypothetical protein